MSNLVLRYIITFQFFTLFCACHESSKYSFKKERKVILNDSLCNVISYFPVMVSSAPDSSLSKLNAILESINEMSRYGHDCSRFFSEEFKNKKKTIIGDYSILFMTDSLVSIEYVLKSDNFSRMRYRVISIVPKEKKLVDPESIFPILDRSKLYPHVQKFCDSTGIDINMLAYEKNSKYVIMYSCTEKDLVLYLGGEGEFEGYYKILIPLKEL